MKGYGGRHRSLGPPGRLGRSAAPRGEDAPRRAGKIFPALSIRQPGQPARPCRDHGGRDSGADRGGAWSTSSQASVRRAPWWARGGASRRESPASVVHAVMPSDSFHGLEGMKHIPTAIRPGIYDESVHDHLIPANTEESYDLAERIAKEEGPFYRSTPQAPRWWAYARWRSG